MPLLPFEKTLTCPYNPSHQITPARMAFHLTKCSKNHPKSGLVICPFNVTHHIPKLEEQYHMTVCEDRKSVELLKYSSDSSRHILPEVTVNQVELGCTEDWEAEAVTGSYDPSKAAAKSNVLRKIEGATPSQRREFRIKERDRLERLASGLSVDDSEDLDKTLSFLGLAPQHKNYREPTELAKSTSRYLGSTDTLMQVHLGRGNRDLKNEDCRRPGPVDYDSISKETNLRPVGRGRASFGVNPRVPTLARGRELQILCLEDGRIRES